ncbi:MAG: thioredoxin family protein [Urechidicola sp.]
MEIINKKSVKEIIKTSLKNSFSYDDYKELVKRLVQEESTTGEQKTEVLANYTKLNHRRMKRWDKTLKIGDKQVNEIGQYDKKVTWLVLTESWCGDAAHIMPVINQVTSLNNLIDFKVVLRDENLELMNSFLTNGNQSIPKMIAIDNETGEVVSTYGPRPSDATELVNEYKQKHGKLTPEFKEDLQRWYNKDKGQNALDDLIKLLGH